MTNGEKWLAKVYARLQGWCKTRAWQCGPARPNGTDQYEVWIGDRTGREAPIAFALGYGDRPTLLDDAGRDRDFDAVTFDRFMEPHGLAGKPMVSKRQFTLNFVGT